MSNNNPFHESEQTIGSLKREHTQVSSLNAAGVSNLVHACDLAVRELYTLATNTSFPYKSFKPYHQPESLVQQLGIRNAYSSESQKFLAQLTGYNLADVRYEETQAYRNYTSVKSLDLAGQLLSFV